MLECENPYQTQVTMLGGNTTYNQCSHRDTPACVCTESGCTPTPHSTSWKNQSNVTWDAQAHLPWHCSGLAPSSIFHSWFAQRGSSTIYHLSGQNIHLGKSIFVHAELCLQLGWFLGKIKSNQPRTTPAPEHHSLLIHASSPKHPSFHILMYIKTRPASDSLVGSGIAGSNIHTKHRHSFRPSFGRALEINILEALTFWWP